MKNLVLVLVVVFGLTTLIGCNKKKKDEAAELNGVVTENVVSVTDNSAQNVDVTNAVPVVVENAAAAAAQAIEPVASGADALSKPTPKLIQQALKNAGLYDGKVDGNIGPKTKKAIEAFQSQNSLKPDGKVGRKTWKALSAYLNKPSEVNNPSAESQAVSQ
ncbi:MAG: peptidoglycan-binding protein [Candidatus Omnitrophica bacterium]|nr:peptidoglycan-binding protein [Candidatus Omnitrophota bacterium]